MSQMDQLSALTAAIRAAPELGSSPGAALAVSQTPQPMANAQATGLALQSQAYTSAAQDYTQTNGTPPPHHGGGLIGAIGGFVGHAFHDISNDVLKPIERQRIPGTDIHPAGPVLQGAASTMPALGTAATQAMQIANMPLAEVQHNYRYIRDVWNRHGPIPAIAELAGIVGTGVAVGARTDNARMGILAGEAAGFAMGNVFYRDSWDRTANGSAYRDGKPVVDPVTGKTTYTGQLVSPGRDAVRVAAWLDSHAGPAKPVVAGLLGALGEAGVNGQSHGFRHGVVSGSLDAGLDMMLDPVQNVGGIYGEAKSGLGGGRLFPGTSAWAPGDAVRLDARPVWDPAAVQFRRAVDWMVSKSPAEIGRRFNDLSEVPGLLDRLGAADSHQGIIDVFENRLAFERSVQEGTFVPQEILNPPTAPLTRSQQLGAGIAPAFVQGLPTQSSFVGMLEAGKDYAMNAGGRLQALGQRARMFSRIPEDARIMLSGDSGIENFFRIGRMGMPDRLVNDLANQFLLTNDVNERIRIVRSLVQGSALSRVGLLDEAQANPDILNQVKAKLDEIYVDRGGVYDINDKGQNISDLLLRDAEGNVVATTSAAGHERQLEMSVGVPNYGDFKDLAQSLVQWRNTFGKVAGGADDFLWEHVTSGWRRLALLSGGFALHIAGAEQLLNSARHGFIPMADGAVQGLEQRLGMRVAAGDAGPVRTMIYHLMGAPNASEWDASIGGVRRAREALKAATEETRPAAEAALQAANAHVKEVGDKMGLAGFMTVMGNGTQIRPELSANYVFPESYRAPVETMRTGIDAASDTTIATGFDQKSLQLKRGEIVGTKYQLYRGDDRNAAVWWGQYLNNFVHDPVDPIGAAAMRGALLRGENIDEASLKAYQAMNDVMSRWTPEQRQWYLRAANSSIDGLDPMDAFARHKVEALKGAVTGADGTVHTDLLAKIATADPVTWRDLVDVPVAKRPWNIPGREINRMGFSGRIQRIAEIGHEKVLGPFINMAVRQPTYFNDVWDAYKAYQPLVDAGLLDEGYAKSLAMQDGVRKMIPFIHNPHERLQLTETMRNVAPFWFAQVQSYKRFGRLLLEDPGAFRKAQLMLTQLTDFANRQTDAGGQQQVVYPGSGFITHGMLSILHLIGMQSMGPFTTAVPVAFAGNTSSMSAIDPFMQGTSGVRPSVGPLVALAAKGIEAFDPQASHVVASAVGSQTASESLWSLIPNTPVRNAILGLIPAIPGVVVGNDSIWMQTVANLDYAQNVAMSKWMQTDQYKQFVANGGDPNSTAAYAAGRPQIVPAPEDPGVVSSATSVSAHQALVDSVKNQARWVRFVQAVMSEVTPASPQALVGNKKIPLEFQKLVQTEGLAKAYQDFALKYPDGAPLIEAMSNVAGGGVLAASKSAMNWVDANKNWVDANKQIASFFVPQVSGDKYYAPAYNEQVAMGLRTRKSPTEFQNDFYINQGWQEYDANRVIYNQQLAAGADPTAERQAWDAWLVGFKAQHPTWAATYDNQNNQIEARTQFNQLKQILKSGNYPATPQIDVLKNMVAQYDNYASMLQPGTNGMISTTTSVNLPTTQAWEAWLKGMAKDHPEYAPPINKIFRWLTPVTQYG